MTKEEAKEILQMEVDWDWEKFRREAVKDILQSIIVTASQVYEMESLNKSIWCEQAIEWADTLIAKLKEK